MLPSVRKAEAEAEAKAEAEAAAKAKAEAEVVATDKAGETPGDICKVITRQLYIPYKTPLHTAYGEVKGACTMLIEVHTTQTIGYGECVFQDVSLGGRAMKAVVDTAASWSACCFEHLGACRRQTPRTHVDRRVPKNASHQDLSDATLRFYHALGVCRQHALKSS